MYVSTHRSPDKIDKYIHDHDHDDDDDQDDDNDDIFAASVDGQSIWCGPLGNKQNTVE